jgi:S1-C subfamily serine protease
LNLTQAIEQIRPSVVQILLLATDFSEILRGEVLPFVSHVLGTGFLVNPDGFAITAHHVIEGGHSIAEQIQAGQKQILVGLAQPNTENMRGNFAVVDFEVIEKDVRHDLALLKLKRNPFKGEVRSGIVIGDKEVPLLFGTAMLNPKRPKDGAAVGISGYPLGEPVLVTNAGWMATSWAFEIKEVPVPGAPEWFCMPDIADAYLADVEVNPGNSGAPVFLVENATVIGVCIGSKLAPIRNQQGNVEEPKLFYSSGLTVVVPVSYVIELLKKHHLTWSELS